MKKFVLGMSALALAASAARLPPKATTRRLPQRPTRLSFTKLDADADGRVSAIEAANDSKVAAGFTAADADKDGYLSKEEFAQRRQGVDRSSGAHAALRAR